jgi:hypothetical protein
MTAIVTLIPAYKPEYLEDLFTGLNSQSFKDFRIVLSDDSPDGEVTRRIRAGMYENLIKNLNLLVLSGPRKGANKNIQYLIKGWGNEASLIHIHLDDDVIYPDFYRAHVAANPSRAFSASVSLRWITAPDGRPSQRLSLPAFLETDNSRLVTVSSKNLFDSTIPHCVNWLGELSNIVLDARSAHRYLDTRIADISYYGLEDVGLLLDISRESPLVVIRDHLGGFRSNPYQTSVQLKSHAIKCGHLAWGALAIAALTEGRLKPQAVVKSLRIVLERSSRLYADDKQMEPFLQLLTNKVDDLDSLGSEFQFLWHQFLDSNPHSSLRAGTGHLT